MTQTEATPAAVPEIKIDDCTFRFPYHHLFRPLLAAEYDDLKESIRKHGIQSPVKVVVQDGPGLVLDVLDGEHRVRIAAELGIPAIDIKREHVVGDQAVYDELARELNTARRHLTVEERREQAVALRTEGQSYRKIGERLGVDEKTIRLDVKAAGAEYSAPDTVTGRDGKTYRATEPEPTDGEIEIARDLVSHALSYWKRPANRGYIYNAVQRDEGGAGTTKKAVEAALYRMVQAGSVVELKDDYQRPVYALADSPAALGHHSDLVRNFKVTILKLLEQGPRTARQLHASLCPDANDKPRVAALSLALKTLVSEHRAKQVRDLYILNREAPPASIDDLLDQPVVKSAPPQHEPEPPSTVEEWDAANGFVEGSAIPGAHKTGNGMDVHYSSESPEWYTPADIIERVVTAMTGIDLDPCSNSHETPHVPAAMHYTKEDDGLAQEWEGKTFLNPPYGREIAQWVEKLVSEHKAGRVTQAIALVPARTDTAWFAAMRDFPRCFITGRLTFIKPDEGEADPAPFPSCAIYIGDEIDRFAAAFADIGDIYVRYQAPKAEDGGVQL
ncbi:MAG: DNA N-6-adenine-methyltransferase [Thiohalobacteraceae bacterium]